MIVPSPVYAYSIAHLSAIVKGFLKTFSKSFREEDCWEKITDKLVPLAPLRSVNRFLKNFLKFWRVFCERERQSDELVHLALRQFDQLVNQFCPYFSIFIYITVQSSIISKHHLEPDVR